jgi:hypothetical protein
MPKGQPQSRLVLALRIMVIDDGGNGGVGSRAGVDVGIWEACSMR